MATAEFSKFAGILSAALSQHHLSGFGIAQLDSITSTSFILSGASLRPLDDCTHEIKRYLLLGRKVMTKLGSILKSRDITLQTNVCLVKGMVFPVVMYGCESWTIKKAECCSLVLPVMLSNWGIGEDS